MAKWEGRMLHDKERWKEVEFLVFVIQGGIGRNIEATAVVRALKKAYPEKKIVVICGSPDVFLKNPYIHRIYHLGQPVFFFDDYFLKGRSVVLNVEPYQHFDYVYGRHHFIECWCDMLGVPCDGVRPDLFLSDSENRMAKIFVDKFGKELILIQGEGGKIPANDTEKEDIVSKSSMYKRSLKKDIIQGVTDEFLKRDFAVGVVRTPNQFLPKGAESINFPIRSILALIPHLAGMVCVDSFLMHGAAIFEVPAVVFWGGTNPKLLGYESNRNVVKAVCPTPMCHRPNSYLWDFEPTGFMWDCPHNDKCMDYSVMEVMAEVDKLMGGRHGKLGQRVEEQRGCGGECQVKSEGVGGQA